MKRLPNPNITLLALLAIGVISVAGCKAKTDTDGNPAMSEQQKALIKKHKQQGE